MIKNLFLLILLTFALSFFGQESESIDKFYRKYLKKTISQVYAYPNPFEQKSNIIFVSSIKQNLSFEVKNVLGIGVFKIHFISVSGKNEFIFYKKNINPGMYIYSLQTDTEVISKRLVVL